MVLAVEARDVAGDGGMTPFMAHFQAAVCTHLGLACDGKARGKVSENLQCLPCGKYCDVPQQ